MCVPAQLCLALCNPMGCSQPGSSVHGIFQARVLGWVVISSYRGYSRPRDWTCISCISCIGRQVLYHCATWEAPSVMIFNIYCLLTLSQPQCLVLFLNIQSYKIDTVISILQMRNQVSILADSRARAFKYWLLLPFLIARHHLVLQMFYDVLQGC